MRRRCSSIKPADDYGLVKYYDEAGSRPQVRFCLIVVFPARFKNQVARSRYVLGCDKCASYVWVK